MLGRIFAVLSLSAFFFSAVNGTLPDLSGAVLDGAAGAVTLVLTLLGVMTLWSGILEVFRESGAVGALAKVLSPVLGRLFPESEKRRKAGLPSASEDLCAALCANLLGAGNAATPLGLSAMKRLAAYAPEAGVASDEMIRFTVLSTAAFSLLPSTLIALRYESGSAAPGGVLLPVLLASAAGSLAAVTVTGVFARLCRRKGGAG